MAEGLARKILGEGFQIQSAGSEPSGKVHEQALLVMEEVGIDVSNHSSKGLGELSEAFMSELDYAITLCEEEVCPVLSSTKAKKLHWGMPDPAAASEAEIHESFQVIRDRIAEKLKAFQQDSI